MLSRFRVWLGAGVVGFSRLLSWEVFMEKSFVIRTGLAVLISAVGVLSAADKKIVINAIDNHNRWAFTDEALRDYKNSGKDAAIVLARSPAEMAQEVVDADAVIGGISKDLFR